MADLYEVLVVDGGTRWHAGFVVDDDTETDVLLRRGGRVPLFGSRAALEHAAQEAGLELQDDLPDEVDLDLGGWLTGSAPLPPTGEVLQLWQLLLDDPDAAPRAGKGLSADAVEDAYDDLTDDEHDWADNHAETARTALADAVRRLRAVMGPA